MRGDWCPYDQVRDCSHDDLHDEHREFYNRIAALEAALAEARREYEGPMSEEIQALQQALAERTRERDLLKGQLDADDTRIYNLYMTERTEDRAAIRWLKRKPNDERSPIAEWDAWWDEEPQHAPAIARASQGE